MSELKSKRVLVSDNLSEKGVALLKQEPGISVDVKTGLSEDELVSIIGDYDALVIRSATKVNERVINAADRMVVVGRAGIGLDNVDADAATKRGIIVMNTPGGNVITTAEHAMSLMLSMSREIPQANASMKAKKWEKKKFMGVEVFNKTLGVVGLGRIGSVVVRLARGMGMKVVVYDPFISLQAAKRMEVSVVTFDELLEKSDFITVHTPLTKDTKYILNDAAFAKMKKGVRIVNCARGGIVDEGALIRAIDAGIVEGAAFDVYESEPPPSDSPLIGNPKVIATPHLGASTVEAQEKVAVAVAEQVIDVLNTGTVRNAVNTPSVSREILAKVEPYLKLSEKLGKIAAQIAEGRLEKLEIQYSGDILKEDVSFMTVAAIKGVLEPVMRDQVNYVNAPVVAEERNIQVNEVRENRAGDYSNMVTVTLYTDIGRDNGANGKISISGTIFANKQTKIVMLNDFPIEVNIVSNSILILTNDDMPGVVGDVGSILGKNNINIGCMNLGRDIKKGSAVSVINVDRHVTDDVVTELQSIKHVTDVKLVNV